MSRLKWSVPFDTKGRTAKQNAITETLAHGCRLVGMSGILSEKGALEYLTRAYICTVAGMPDFRDITFDDVLAHIGLRTNSEPLARPRFNADINRWIGERADRELLLGIDRPTLKLWVVEQLRHETVLPITRIAR